MRGGGRAVIFERVSRLAGFVERCCDLDDGKVIKA